MQRESAAAFWNKYLSLVCNGGAPIGVENPAVDFTIRVKAGEFDRTSDEEYDALLKECNEFSAIWQNQKHGSAGEVLLKALEMTRVSDAFRKRIADMLAECSAHTEYLSEPEPRRQDPSAREYDNSRRNVSDGRSEWSPKAIYSYLSQRVHGQDDAKRAAAMLLYNHVEGRRSTAVFCGPSGCGKSEIWRHLAKEYPDLIRVVDASRLSADGWRGSLHVRDIFEDVPAGDLADVGLIVVLDEADKICCETAVGSGGTDYNALIQNSLLKLLDGDTIQFGAEDKKRAFQVDCSRVSVVLLGAFERLMQSKSSGVGGIGFGAAPRKSCDYSNTTISYEDLISAGMRREIAGRVNRIVSLRPLSAADYKDILTGPVLDDLQAAGEYRIVIDDDSAELLSERAAATGLGVRWMRSQVMNAVDALMFDDPAAALYKVKI